MRIVVVIVVVVVAVVIPFVASPMSPRIPRRGFANGRNYFVGGGRQLATMIPTLRRRGREAVKDVVRLAASLELITEMNLAQRVVHSTWR